MTDVLLATDRGLYSVASGEVVALDGQTVRDVRSDPRGWWALTESGQVWCQAAGGEPGVVGALSDVAATCVLPVGGGQALVGSDGARLWWVDRDGAEALDSFDRADGRDGWYTPWGGPPATRTLAASVNGDLYVNVHVGGILRSSDDGRRWEPTIDIDADVHEVATVEHRPSTVLAATAYGLAVSDDAGQTWDFRTDGLHASYCRAVAIAGARAYVSASTGPYTSRAAVYRATLDGGDLVRCAHGLPEWFAANVDSRCLAAAGDTVVVSTDGGEVYLSDDGGERWRQAAEGLPSIRALTLL